MQSGCLGRRDEYDIHSESDSLRRSESKSYLALSANKYVKVSTEK